MKEGAEGEEHLSLAWQYTNESNHIIQDMVVIPASFSRVAMPADALTSISTRVPTNVPTLATASPSRFPTTAPTSVPTNAPTHVPTSPAEECTYTKADGTVTPVLPWSSTTTYVNGDYVRLNNDKFVCYNSDLCSTPAFQPTLDSGGSWTLAWETTGQCPLSTASPSQFPTAAPTSVPTNAPTHVPTSPAEECTYTKADGTVTPVLPWSSTTTYVNGDYVRLNNDKFVCYNSDLCSTSAFQPTLDSGGSWTLAWETTGQCPSSSTTPSPTPAGSSPTGECTYTKPDGTIAPILPWSGTTTIYSIGDAVRVHDRIYRCNDGGGNCQNSLYQPNDVDHTWSGTWIIGELCSSIALTTSAPTTTPAPTPATTLECLYLRDGTSYPTLAWSSTTTYVVGDKVRLNNDKFECIDSNGFCNMATYQPSTVDYTWSGVWINVGTCPH
jgi:hypothetical protein